MNSNRREFLKATLGSSAVISLGAATPAFLLEAAATGLAGGKETVLVVVQLSGGNDGLNTVIPFSDPVYRKNRPTLAISQSDVLKIDEQLGFHPAARGLADLLEDDKLAIIQGVGYPNPNRSHFESMDIWHSCQRKGNPRTTGWLGRYLDATRRSAGGDAPALHLGGEIQPLAVTADNVRVPSIRSLERFRLQDGGDKELRAAIGEMSASRRTGGNDLIGFIQTSTVAALQASRRVEEARKGYQTPIEYPDSPLAEKLRTVAQLIDAGLTTRVYYMEVGGFDTHSRQAAAHNALLNQFGGAANAFIKDVAHHGHGKRVIVMAFSEFGRRVQENASEGTDHGAAAPMFLAGEKVKSGLLGRHPNLDDLHDGDVKHHTDFRQVYAAVLDDWLGAPSKTLLGKEYAKVDVIKA